jgi:undecaprenyl-diphosphatase
MPCTEPEVMSTQTVPTSMAAPDPTVDRASPAGWRARLDRLVHGGRDRLAAMVIALMLGFGVGAAALLFFALLADDVAEGETLQLDMTVLLWLRQFESPTLDVVARVFSALGSEVLAVLAVVLLVGLVVGRRWGAAVAVLVTTVGAQLLNNVLKDLFHRTRPAPVLGLIPAQAFSFPSGHAMVATAFYGFLTYLAWRLLQGWLRWLALTVLVLLVLGIGLSRLYLGVHYLTDVVAGYITGFIWVDTVILAGWVLRSRRRRTPEGQAPVGQETAAPAEPPPTGQGR